MYSEFLQEYVNELAVLAEIEPDAIPLLQETVACFIGLWGRAIGAETTPSEDILQLTVRLLLLDQAVSELQVNSPIAEHLHYLIGMGFEQSGSLLSRFSTLDPNSSASESPLQNNHWYRLALSMLHYLAGGYRLQALTVLRQIEYITEQIISSEEQTNDYRVVYAALVDLYGGTRVGSDSDYHQLFTTDRNSLTTQRRRLQRLLDRIQQRSQVLLNQLGQDRPSEWLAQRQIYSDRAVQFWTEYLNQLHRRRITAFTTEQVGPGFEQWLQIGSNLVVDLPTGSGKTIIGELMTALVLASGRQVIWILPTRSLVRQLLRELRNAFPESLSVNIDELPVTEDFFPLFADIELEQRHVAITTPEKLAALLRSNPMAASSIGLVVFDEAQLLFANNSRSVIAESVVKDIHLRSKCKLVLMTAFPEYQEPLAELAKKLSESDSEPIILASSTRPTRRLNGILTKNTANGGSHPIIFLYPPGSQAEEKTTVSPLTMILRNGRKSSSNIGATKLAEILGRATTQTGIRTVIFVSYKHSTESLAERISASRMRMASPTVIPQNDVQRLGVELGRSSTLASIAQYGVCAHHAGLTPLEQHLVETWVQKGVVNTVVATPTLAQGVNLPFDLSIVTFLQRQSEESDQANRKMEPLPISEVQNMLGRAGRAGQVSDGVCLIAVKSSQRDPVQALDRQRKWFFSRGTVAENLGLGQLLKKTDGVDIAQPDWPLQLSGLSFGECQTLLSFAVSVTENSPDNTEALYDALIQFPSLGKMTSTDVRVSAEKLVHLASTLRHTGGNDPIIAAAIARTGMPIEVIVYFVQELRNIVSISHQGHDDTLAWMDEIVFQSFIRTLSRDWNRQLLNDLKIPISAAMTAIKLWRSGAQIRDIEDSWLPSNEIKRIQRVQMGGFLNHGVSLLSQFWGALAVCAELISTDLGFDLTDITMKQAQMYVREGVSNALQLEWLRRTGGLDRVLAHRLDDISIVDRSDPRGIRRYVQNQLREWRRNPRAISPTLPEPYRSVLQNLLLS